MTEASDTYRQLILARCFNHADREAVARCPRCSRYFCRECVTEHDDQLICAACLAEPTAGGPGHWLTGGYTLIAGAVGLAIAWGCFYFVGRMLLRLPSSFHEGTIWLE